MSAASKKALADPEVRAFNARKIARKVVKKADLPLTKRNVDRAAELLAGGHDQETALDALIQESIGAAA